MKLTSAAETIIAEDSGASLHNRVTELEKDKNALQRVVDLVIEDYNLVVTGNKKLASECDKLKHRCEGLKAELSEARSDAHKRIDNLEPRVRSVKACSVDVATDSKKRLGDFENDLVRKLEKMCGLYG
jgi:SMC interacting uncharacterized protein involved in chromosome segregation